MKKIISTVLVCVLLLGTLLTLASCSKMISGTYKNEYTQTEYIFSGNKVKIIRLIGGSSDATYEITEKEGGSMTITFTYAEGETEDDDLKGTLPFTEGEENGKKYIKIGSIGKCYKVD